MSAVVIVDALLALQHSQADACNLQNDPNHARTLIRFGWQMIREARQVGTVKSEMDANIASSAGDRHGRQFLRQAQVSLPL
jgi:hypothetical protein